MNVPARVAADAENAMNSIRELANAAQPPAPAANEPPAPPANEPPAPQPTPPAPAATPVDLGAELARVNRQLGSLAGRLEQSELERNRLLRELEQSRQAPPAPAQPPAPPQSLISQKEREEFGEELIDLITRVVRQEAGAKIDQLGTRIAGLEGRIGKAEQNVTQTVETQAQREWKNYLAALKARVPTWEAVNQEQGFLDWLEKVDTFSGKKLLDLLVEAHNEMNLERVVSFFVTYKPELGNAPPAAAANPNTPPQPAAPAAPAPFVDPATLAAPATQAPAPAPSQQPTGRIWKQSEVDSMYERRNKGLLNEADFKREEANYLDALANGRVVANA